MSVGLWADSEGRSDDAEAAVDGSDVLSPAAMAEALSAAIAAGATAVSVTPLSMMTAEHWALLPAAWSG